MFLNIRESAQSEYCYDIYILVQGITDTKMYDTLKGHFGKLVANVTVKNPNDGIFLPPDEKVL